MRTRILLILFGFIFIVASTQTARAQMIPVTSCGQTLSAPGEYILMNDLNCTAAGDVVGVQITASNVAFHLAGRTISSPLCDQNRSVIGIFAIGGVTNVKIDGGNISGFNDGILLSSSNSAVKGVKVTGACSFGIHVQGADNRVEKNTVAASGDGVLLLAATNSVVRCNNLSGNTRTGVAISGNSATANLVEDNIVNNNGAAEGYGVAVFNGTGNMIRDNAINHNLNGILINSPNNRVRENTVNGSADVGISITGAGAPSIVRRNVVLGSGNTDMTDDSAACGINLWRNNTFTTDLVNGATDGGANAGCIR